MVDTSNQWLVQQLQQASAGNNVWCCDENMLDHIPDVAHWPHKPQFISNRWDIAQQAIKLGFNTAFSDFDLSSIQDASIDHVFYRISKEKAVTHHLINQAFRVLKPGGVLWLCGQKNEGIKTYIEKAFALFGSDKKIYKDGANYYGVIFKQALSNPLLNDENYLQLRPCLTIGGHAIHSKPGQFGWNKIDQGSALMMTEVTGRLVGRSIPSCLDLGCGYGFLTIAASELAIHKRVLTDNNAAALLSADYNCRQLGLTADIVPSDAGQELPDSFELILCNPPFHQGFTTDGDLTTKFLSSSARLLSKQGSAYYVVNQFIPLEKKALQYFKQVTVVAVNKSFKVFELRHI